MCDNVIKAVITMRAGGYWRLAMIVIDPRRHLCCLLSEWESTCAVTNQDITTFCVTSSATKYVTMSFKLWQQWQQAFFVAWHSLLYTRVVIYAACGASGSRQVPWRIMTWSHFSRAIRPLNMRQCHLSSDNSGNKRFSWVSTHCYIPVSSFELLVVRLGIDKSHEQSWHNHIFR
jgi:hypothetical protein